MQTSAKLNDYAINLTDVKLTPAICWERFRTYSVYLAIIEVFATELIWDCHFPRHHPRSRKLSGRR